MTTKRVEQIRALLQAAFEPEALEVIDEGHLHIGHAGAKSGLGHFRVTILSAHFNDMRVLARHRAIYAALGDLMRTDIHALTIDAVASAKS